MTTATLSSLIRRSPRTPVRYCNRYGIEIAADLYTATGLDRGMRHPGIVIGPPHSGVKEHGLGVYAQELAKRGFAPCPSTRPTTVRAVASPAASRLRRSSRRTSAPASTTLAPCTFVDRESLGSIGLCGSGGFALSAAQIDPRIKVVATSAMYDISGVKRNGWENKGTEEERREKLAAVAAQRWKSTPGSRHWSRLSRPSSTLRAWTR